MLVLCMLLQIINKVKVTHHNQSKNIYLLMILCKFLLISLFYLLYPSHPLYVATDH